jgi:hypothetical protein
MAVAKPKKQARLSAGPSAVRRSRRTNRLFAFSAARIVEFAVPLLIGLRGALWAALLLLLPLAVRAALLLLTALLVLLLLLTRLLVVLVCHGRFLFRNE